MEPQRLPGCGRKCDREGPRALAAAEPQHLPCGLRAAAGGPHPSAPASLLVGRGVNSPVRTGWPSGTDFWTTGHTLPSWRHAPAPHPHPHPYRLATEVPGGGGGSQGQPLALGGGSYLCGGAVIGGVSSPPALTPTLPLPLHKLPNSSMAQSGNGLTHHRAEIAGVIGFQGQERRGSAQHMSLGMHPTSSPNSLRGISHLLESPPRPLARAQRTPDFP